MSPRKNCQPQGKSPIRVHLLVLLWIWSVLIFIVVDLFLDVPEFDSMRPDSSIYRGTRVAAHEMVGTEVDPSEREPGTTADSTPVARYSPVPEPVFRFTGGDGAIHGEVVFESGEPATYFEYRLVKGINARGRRTPEWIGISGAGRFSIGNLQPGVYRMWVRSPGSRPVSVAGVRAGTGDPARVLRIVVNKPK